MPLLRTDTCRNPDHEYVQSKYADPTPATWYRSREAGRPRVYCDSRCKNWYMHNYDREGNRVRRSHPSALAWVKAKRDYATAMKSGISRKDARILEVPWPQEGAPRPVAEVLARDPDARDPSTLSLDMNDGLEHAVTNPRHEHMELSDMPAFQYPNRPGFLIKLTPYRAGSTDVPGDGLSIQVLRASDNAVMSMSHPQAAEIAAELASAEWQDKYHNFLELLREMAGTWDVAALGPEPDDGEWSPAIPASAGTPEGWPDNGATDEETKDYMADWANGIALSVVKPD